MGGAGVGPLCHELSESQVNYLVFVYGTEKARTLRQERVWFFVRDTTFGDGLLKIELLCFGDCTGPYFHGCLHATTVRSDMVRVSFCNGKMQLTIQL